MELRLLEPHFTICKVPDLGSVNWNTPFCFASRTDEECSLVCPEEYVPVSAVERNDGWRAVRIEGVLDFSLVGILAEITGVLAKQKIPVFVVSTFNTDYVLMKHEYMLSAICVLEKTGWSVIQK